MPVVRRFLAQSQKYNQVLRLDCKPRFVTLTEDKWQFLFGPKSVFSERDFVVKMAARFNDETMSSIKMAAYLYSPSTGGVNNAATAVFDIYKTSGPNWNDEHITTVSGLVQSNSYFYYELNSSAIGTDFLGETTLMIECVLTRLGEKFRDRVYVNHLGIFDNCFRLKQEIDFLDLIKKDE